MSKIIIGIHGLGNKPPKQNLSDLWQKNIIWCLEKYNYSKFNFDFELVYWADILHPVPLNPEDYVPILDKNESLSGKTQFLSELPELRIKAKEYLEKFYGKILVNEVLSLKYPSFTDLFIHLNMRDLEKYYSSFYVINDGLKRLAKDAIIDRLSGMLSKHKGKEILLISHSMGSIISHDTLINDSTHVHIDTLVTLGSPLGQKYVLNKLLDDQKNNIVNKLRVPENVKRNWYNLSDLEDQVALNHLLSEIYVPNSKKVKIKDMLVQNNFLNNGVRNPHSVYGYLRTQEIAEIINSFLSAKKFNLLGWFNFTRKNKLLSL